MTRPLLIIAACGLIVSVACFATVAALGGISFDDENGIGPNIFGSRSVEGGGPQATRELTWTGGDQLTVNVPATVNYTQGPVASLTIVGPQRTLDMVKLEGGALRFDGRIVRPGRLTVTMTAPDVRTFTLNGSQKLTIAGFDHDTLKIAVFGSGDVTGAGRARRVDLSIAGSGDVDLSAVAAEVAKVNIAGSGDATLSPTLEADVNIAGSGDVNLTTRPPRIDTKIAGSGRVVQGAPAPDPAAGTI
jgi:hypothetical protein